MDEFPAGRGNVAGRPRRLEVPPHRILEPRAALQIAVESIRDIQNALDVFHREGFPLVDGEGLRGADGVFDLVKQG